MNNVFVIINPPLLCFFFVCFFRPSWHLERLLLTTGSKPSWRWSSIVLSVTRDSQWRWWWWYRYENNGFINWMWTKDIIEYEVKRINRLKTEIDLYSGKIFTFTRKMPRWCFLIASGSMSEPRWMWGHLLNILPFSFTHFCFTNCNKLQTV